MVLASVSPTVLATMTTSGVHASGMETLLPPAAARAIAQHAAVAIAARAPSHCQAGPDTTVMASINPGSDSTTPHQAWKETVLVA